MPCFFTVQSHLTEEGCELADNWSRAEFLLGQKFFFEKTEKSGLSRHGAARPANMAPVDHLKFCSERGRLLDLMNNASRDYARAANELASRMATMVDADYRRVHAEVEQARLDAEHCRGALLQHQREHGC
jgi:hypothetical protein